MDKTSFDAYLNDRVDKRKLLKVKQNPLIKEIDGGEFLFNAVTNLKKYQRFYRKNPDYIMDSNESNKLKNYLYNINLQLLCPEITYVNSSNIFGYSLEFIRNLLIDKYLRKRVIWENWSCGFVLSEDRIKEISLAFKPSLVQALEYLDMAIKADVTTAPVLLYYSSLNFLACYNLLTYPEALHDKKNRSHGMQSPVIDEVNILNTKIHFGTNGNLRHYLSKNNLSLKQNFYTLGDALKSLSYMRDILSKMDIQSYVIPIYNHTQDNVILSPMGVVPGRISFDSKLFEQVEGTQIFDSNATKVLEYFSPNFNSLLKNHIIDIQNISVVRNTKNQSIATIDCCPQNHYQAEIIEYIACERDHNSNRFIILEPNTAVNDEFFHMHSSLYLFSMLSRYHPLIWNNYLSDPSNRVFIQKYITSSAISLLYKFLTRLTREIYVYK